MPGPTLTPMPGLPDRVGPPRPVPALPVSRIQLIQKAVTHRNHSGDASCGKSPQDASPKLDPTTQLNENKQLKTSLLKLPHTGNMRHPGRVPYRPWEAFVTHVKHPWPAARIVPRPLARRRTPAVPSAASHPPPKRVSMWHRPLVRALSTIMTARRSQK